MMYPNDIRLVAPRGGVRAYVVRKWAMVTVNPLSAGLISCRASKSLARNQFINSSWVVIPEKCGEHNIVSKATLAQLVFANLDASGMDNLGAYAIQLFQVPTDCEW